MPSKTLKQAKFMAACAHDADYDSCPPDEVSKEFNQADKKANKMKTFKEFGRPVKNKPTVADHSDIKNYKIGDIVHTLQPDNATWLPGKIKRFGQTMVHVVHNDGSEAAYRPEHIGMRVNSFNPKEDGKKKVFGE